MTDSVESVLQKLAEIERLQDKFNNEHYLDKPETDLLNAHITTLRSALEPMLAELKETIEIEHKALDREYARYAACCASRLEHAKRAEAAEQALREARQLIKDYKEVNEDKKRLVRELDVALHGKAGAAQQASLCDLIGPAEDMRADSEKLRELLRHCPICDHEWNRHDPDDGQCDDGPPCYCGRDLAKMQGRISDLSQQALSPSPTPAQEITSVVKCICGHSRLWHANFGSAGCDECTCMQFTATDSEAATTGKGEQG